MKRTDIPLAPLILATLLVVACRSIAGPPEVGKTTAPIKGFPKASLTIFPLTVFTSGERWQQDEAHRAWAAAFERGFLEDKARSCANTLGLLLEERGYDKVKMADRAFELPRDKAAREARVAAFGKLVSKLDLKTDYALWTEVGLTEESGLHVYSVIVDAKGHIAWQDSQEQRGRTVFDCLEVTCNRLVPVLGLDKLPKREMAEDKKRMLREARTKEPPSGSERKAMKERREALKKAGASARVRVYPARVGGDHTEASCATHLCKLLDDAKLCQATAAESGSVMEGSGWPNEMQVLWLFARTVREYVREHPADSAYVLFPDYWFNPRGQVWAVHFVVCDRAGDWVIVDLQNSHQEDFQRVNPQNLQDCDRLVMERFRANVFGKSEPGLHLLDNPPELTVLEQRIGTWTTETVIKPGPWNPDERKVTGVETTEWILGGRFQQTRNTSRPANPDSVYLCTYDPQARVFRSWFFDDQGGNNEMTGQWDEAAQTINWASETDGFRATGATHMIDPNKIEWQLSIKDRDGKVMIEMAGKLVRKK